MVRATCTEPRVPRCCCGGPPRTACGAMAKWRSWSSTTGASSAATRSSSGSGSLPRRTGWPRAVSARWRADRRNAVGPRSPTSSRRATRRGLRPVHRRPRPERALGGRGAPGSRSGDVRSSGTAPGRWAPLPSFWSDHTACGSIRRERCRGAITSRLDGDHDGRATSQLSSPGDRAPVRGADSSARPARPDPAIRRQIELSM